MIIIATISSVYNIKPSTCEKTVFCGRCFAAAQDVVVVKSAENKTRKTACARFSDNW